MVITSRGDWRRSLLGEGQPGVGRLLFSLFGPPVAWSVHFLIIYFFVALACTSEWGGVRAAVVIVTVPLVAIAAWAGVVAHHAWRKVRGEEAKVVTALTSAEGWLPFIHLVGLVGAALFTAVIVLETVPALIVPPCAPTVPP